MQICHASIRELRLLRDLLLGVSLTPDGLRSILNTVKSSVTHDSREVQL